MNYIGQIYLVVRNDLVRNYLVVRNYLEQNIFDIEKLYCASVNEQVAGPVRSIIATYVKLIKSVTLLVE